jgi:hypothetical protein
MRVFCVLVSLIINARDAKRISLFSFFLLLLLFCVFDRIFFCASAAVEKTSPLSFEEVFVSPQESLLELFCPKTQQKKDHAPKK